MAPSSLPHDDKADLFVGDVVPSAETKLGVVVLLPSSDFAIPLRRLTAKRRRTLNRSMNVKVCSDWNEPKYIDLKHEVWDDGIYSGINEIFLTYSEDRVCSIQVAYNDKSYILLAPKHGDDGTMFQKLKIHYPIISVSGHYEWTKGTFSSDKDLYCVTRSLTFKTSYATYGPYGREIGSPFCYQTDDGVAGFHGKVGGTSSQSYLSNLGVYVRSSATNAAK